MVTLHCLKEKGSAADKSESGEPSTSRAAVKHQQAVADKVPLKGGRKEGAPKRTTLAPPSSVSIHVEETTGESSSGENSVVGEGLRAGSAVSRTSRTSELSMVRYHRRLRTASFALTRDPNMKSRAVDDKLVFSTTLAYRNAVSSLLISGLTAFSSNLVASA